MANTREIEVYLLKVELDECVEDMSLYAHYEIRGSESSYVKAMLTIDVPEKTIEITQSQLERAMEDMDGYTWEGFRKGIISKLGF